MILKQGHTYKPMPHDGKLIAYIYRGGRCYYIASPYSHEATQALKAAFPQYWTAIRNYGVAHPQLVPFVNEDPMLIVSLVEVGKVRYLSSDGYAKIDLGITWSQANYQCDVEFTFLKVTKSGFLFGTQVWSVGTLLVHANPNGTPTMYANTTKDATQNADGTTTVKLVNTSGYTGYGSNSICLMGYCNGHIVESSWREFKGTIGTNVYHLLPFTRNGENGMLDILSGTFYPNANTQGSFTIEITDKA